MMGRWIEDYRKEIIFVSFIVFGLVLVVIAERCISHDWEAVRALVAGLGDALTIAGILGGTVDYFLKKSLVQNVGAIFIGWALPQQVRDYIRKVSQTSVVRKDLRVFYDLTMEGHEVVVKIRMSWDVYNFSTSTESYTPNLSIDLVDKPDESQTTCHVTINDKVEVWDATKFRKLKLVERTDHFVRWQPKTFKLPSQDVEDPRTKPACRVQWVCAQRMPIPYTDLVAMLEPTIGVEITARCPPDIEFVCGDNPLPGAGNMQWPYNKLYMSGQSIRVWWRPKEPQRPIPVSEITSTPTPQMDQAPQTDPPVSGEQATP